MTNEELDRLASIIADALLKSSPTSGGAAASSGTRAPAPAPWLPIPVRPEPPAGGGEPPDWTGAAQTLDDVAPGAREGQPARRRGIGEMAAAVRAAAAGRAPAPEQAEHGRAATPPARQRARGARAIDVTIGVSNRHVHLSSDHCQALFGAAQPTSARPITQPGQYAAAESLRVSGPAGQIDGVRVVGPARGDTQVELSLSDCRRLGIEAPVAASGKLAGSTGGVTLTGSVGTVRLERGVIVAARHLHLSVEDAGRWGLRDGDQLDARCGTGARAVVFQDILVRSGPTHATELHLDTDEANAAGVRTGDKATVFAWRAGAGASRTLVTERDVVALARTGGRLPPGALLTPSARDRAKSLGLAGE
jgi:putative phosphotransacetylase